MQKITFDLKTSATKLETNRDSIRKGETLLRRMVCSKDYVVITTDRLGNIVSWNNDAKAIFGHSIDKVMGKSIMSIIPEHDNVYAPLP
jgi:PAS domain S-box-containing protein